MTTPAERITAYLDARRRFPINTDQLAECKIGGQDWTRLTETDLRAVLADNERLTRELDDLADFDKADERRQRLQDERDRAVKLWHEQHKEVDRLTAQVAAKATPAQLLAAGAATAASYAEAVGRLRHELAEVKAKLAAAEKELDHRRGIRPCHRTAVHPGHLWMLDRKPVTCLGVKDAQPPAVAAPDAQDRAAGGPNVARDGAQRGQGGLAGSKVGTGTTQARESARTPPAAPDPNEAGR